MAEELRTLERQVCVELGWCMQRWWPFGRHAYALHYDIEVDLRKHSGRWRVARQARLPWPPLQIV